MSGYPNPYNTTPPQYPPPQGYPQGYPPPGQNQIYPQVPYGQPGFTYGQPPNVGPVPSAPPAAFSYAQPNVTPTGYPGQPTVTPTPVYPGQGGYGGQVVEWLPATYATVDALAQRAVVAGYEGHDGSPLWVIRAHHEGDIIPGKLAIKHKAAYVPWGGKENHMNQFEVCCAPPDRVRWVASGNGSVPPNAVPGGRTSTGETLYIGRAKEQGSLTPGKIHPSHKTLYKSFGGNEIPHSTYEVLCTV